MATRRILAGGIAQESHSFNPVLMGRSWFNIRAGAEAVIEQASGGSSFFYPCAA